MPDIMMMKHIPGRYYPDFIQKHLVFIKARVRLLCSLTISAYFILAFLDFFFARSEHIVVEITAGLSLVVAGVISLFISARADDLKKARKAVFIFVFMLVVTLMRLGVNYHQGTVASSALYVFSMFIVAMTIPLTPFEVIPMSFLHMAGFFMENLYLVRSGANVGTTDVVGGILFIGVACALCVVIRKKETERDIENFVLFKTLEEKNGQINKELEMATRVHMTIIPEGADTDIADIKVMYLPAYYVGGDYTSYVFLPGEKITFIISDVTGHGVPAALLVNRMHAEFERIAKEGKPPGELMEELNVFIKKDFEASGMYLTAFCGRLDMKKKCLLYSGYAHPPQYLYRKKENDLVALSSDSGMLGLPYGEDHAEQGEITVRKGDKIFLYTDGVTETVNEELEEYGDERLKGFLIENSDKEPTELLEKLLERLNEYKTGAFRDDICALSMELKGHYPYFARRKN